MSRPIEGSYPTYFNNYIPLVDAESPLEALTRYGNDVVKQFYDLPADKADYSYAPGKWTLKEMLLHVIDTERIFAYRALAIARNETQSLPGFDENAYAENSRANERSWSSLLEEFKAVRKSTDLLLQSFDDAQFGKQGTTNNNTTTVNSLAYIIYGHILHHLNIVRLRYLN